MKLLVGRPYVTRAPILVVDQPLAPGTYRFQLVVENHQGKRSRPAEMAVVVQPPERPRGTGSRLPLPVR